MLGNAEKQRRNKEKAPIFRLVLCGGDEGDRTPYLLNAILCCRQVHTNAYQKKNGDKPIFDMACLRIFCMKSVHSLCIHYAACMDKYFGTDRG